MTGNSKVPRWEIEIIYDGRRVQVSTPQDIESLRNRIGELILGYSRLERLTVLRDGKLVVSADVRLVGIEQSEEAL